MQRVIRWYDYITINIYWFALTARSQVLTPLVIPLLVQQFVGEANKGTYVGILRLWALMIAILVQTLMGIVSDRSTLRWGRRRPFIFVGAVAEVFVLALMGLTAGLEGMTGLWTLFALYVLSMISSNIGHAATQGLIPDLVPDAMRGRFSGVKTLFDLPLPVIFVSFVIGKLVASGNLWGALFALIAVLIVCMAIAMLAPETPQKQPPFAVDWQPFLRLALMTAVFTVVILGVGALVSAVTHLSLAQDRQVALGVTGLVGLLGMAFAVGFGVWISLRVGLGEAERRNPSFTWWVITRLAFLVGGTNLAGFFVYFLQERFPELAGTKAAGPAANIVMFVGVFILLSALPSGWLADRFGKKLLSAVGALLAALGTFIVISIPSLNVIYAGGCLIGLGFGVFYAASWALGTEIVPQDQAGRYLGLSNLAGAGAGAIGAYIGGPLGDRMGYTLLMAIYGVLIVLSIPTLLGIRVGLKSE